MWSCASRTSCAPASRPHALVEPTLPFVIPVLVLPGGQEGTAAHAGEHIALVILPHLLGLMDHLKDTAARWREETGIGFSLYGTPAETLCYRFARIDKEKYGDIPNVTDKRPIEAEAYPRLLPPSGSRVLQMIHDPQGELLALGVGMAAALHEPGQLIEADIAQGHGGIAAVQELVNLFALFQAGDGPVLPSSPRAMRRFSGSGWTSGWACVTRR